VIDLKLFRNPEFKKLTGISIILTVVFSAAGFLIETLAGILVLLLGATLFAAYIIYTHNRYKKIAAMSDVIDKILHNNYSPGIDSMEEGELSILQNRIYKLTIKLQEHVMLLQKEKKHLSDSLADISHQLKTPLTSINILLNLMQDENLSRDEKSGYIKEIYELANRMDWLISTLLSISKIDAGVVVFKREKFSAKNLIYKSKEPIDILMEIRGFNFKIQGDIDSPISADFLWTCEALGNILKNCMEHLSGDGEIIVDVKNTNIYLQITVTDNGNGFLKEEIPRVFDRFFKGKNSSSSGVGIGLALSKMIITSQGGTISAKNTPDGGACFVIRFFKLYQSDKSVT